MFQTPTTEGHQNQHQSASKPPQAGVAGAFAFIGGMADVSGKRWTQVASSSSVWLRRPDLARLHRTYGNQAVLRMMNQSVPPPGGRLQRKCACGGPAGTECAGCQEKPEQEPRRFPAQSAATNIAPPIVHDVLRSPGQPLNRSVRTDMEAAFGHEFSNVRIHTNSKAAESARAVNALAYTVGNQVVFGEGQYQPQTQKGRHLIAHELTHTIQQGSPGPSGRHGDLEIGETNDRFEREADRCATHVPRSQDQNHLSTQFQTSPAAIQRQDAGSPDAGSSATPTPVSSPDAGVPPPAPSGSPPSGTAPTTPSAPPTPAVPLTVLRVEVEPGSRDQFSQVPGTGPGTHWVGVASTTAKKPKVRAVLDSAVPATDPRVAGLTWSGPDVTPDPADPLQAEVGRTAGQRQVTATLGGSSASTALWAVFAQIKTTGGPSPSFSSNATAASPGGSINLQATILPNSILTAADHPRLEGPNDTAPPGGVSQATGNPLSGGADHHWDFSRKSRDRVVNPSGIPLGNFIVPGDTGMTTIFGNVPWAYPATWEEGNDDSSTGDETNNPYASPMTSTDRPVDNLLHSAGANGDTFEDHAQFLEFVRLEINKRWWVISAHFPWRVHMKVQKAGGRWVNNGTDTAADNAGF